MTLGLAVEMDDDTTRTHFLFPYIRLRLRELNEGLVLNRPTKARLWYIIQVRVSQENRAINENVTHIKQHLKEGEDEVQIVGFDECVAWVGSVL
jgi:hypothetical protein